MKKKIIIFFFLSLLIIIIFFLLKKDEIKEAKVPSSALEKEEIYNSNIVAPPNPQPLFQKLNPFFLVYLDYNLNY